MRGNWSMEYLGVISYSFFNLEVISYLIFIDLGTPKQPIRKKNPGGTVFGFLILPAISLFTVFGNLHGFLPVIQYFILKFIIAMPTSIGPRYLVVMDLDEQLTLL